jgi:hypothetical protein
LDNRLIVKLVFGVNTILFEVIIFGEKEILVLPKLNI